MTDQQSSALPVDSDDNPKERLLQAALEIFGQLGFDATSTRALAERAGVNVAAIPYYYSSKQGLYLAVAEHIGSRMQSLLKPAMDDIELRFKQSPDEAELRDMLRTLLMPLAEQLIGSPESARWAPFIMREQAHPTAAFDVLHQRCIASVMQTGARILGLLLQQPPDSESNLLTLKTLFGQILVFRASRAAVLRALGWNDFTPERVTRVQDHIWTNVEAILDARMAARRST